MSYNWTSASTPQGRERLKELIDQGHEIATRRTSENMYKNIITHSGLNEHSGDIVIDNDCYEDWEYADENDAFYNLEFIDPSPSPETVDENGLLPCPFCGEKPSGFRYGEWDWWIECHVECGNCSARTSATENYNKKELAQQRAIADWNRRAGKEVNP